MSETSTNGMLPAGQGAPNTTPADPKAPTGATNTNGQPSTGDSVKAAAQEAKRRLKIDDQEVDEDEVLKVYKERKGHQTAANKILQEGKAAKKQAEEFVAMMKDKGKLFDAIQKLGHDPRTLAEEYLAAQLEDDLLDPREKELKSAKSKLKQYEELEKAQKEAAIRKRDEALKAKFSKDYSDQFVEALKTSNLPATKAMVAEMAKYIHRAAGLKFQMTPQEAAQLVKEDIETAYKNLYGEADGETLVKLLGEQGLQKIRTHDTSRLKSPEAHLRTPTEQAEPSARVRSTGKRMTPQEWRAFNRAK